MSATEQQERVALSWDSFWRTYRDNVRGDRLMIAGDEFQDDPRDNPKSVVKILWVDAGDSPRHFVYQRGQQLPVGAPITAAQLWKRL